MNFWDFNVWGFFNLAAVLLLTLITTNIFKKRVKFLRNSLIPTSVLAGLVLLVISTVYKACTGENLFDTGVFNYRGSISLEILTFHCLALGFIATTFASNKPNLNRKREYEIFNSGVTTVATYLLQAIFGISITLVATKFVTGLIPAAGVILPFGYGQGSGQAMNYGNIFQNDYGFIGGKNFGLSIAALGFLCASIGGVVHLNIMKKKGKIKINTEKPMIEIYKENKIDEKFLNGGLDSLTIQIAAIFITYLISYIIISFLGNLAGGLKSVLYGLNFLFGVLIASLIKIILCGLRNAKIFKNNYIDAKEMNKLGNFFFDLMIVSGIAVIQIDLLFEYWHVLLILGIVGLFVTYFYNRFVAKVLFPEYEQEQFLVMYGMLTGTASTGIVLLREIDLNFETPAADNLVLQNFPAIALGFPMMIIATIAPKTPVKVLLICVGYFVVLNIILFRKQIFCRKNK